MHRFIKNIVHHNAMNEQKLVNALASMNVWWSGSPVPQSIKKADIRRKIFFNLCDHS